MSTPVSTSLNIRRRISKTERVAVRERGRICSQDSCDTVLSIYNPARYCSAHATKVLARRRRASQVARAVACEHCGGEFETRNAYRRYCCDRCRMAAFARRKRAASRAESRLQERVAA